MTESSRPVPAVSHSWYWTAPYVAIAVLVVTALAIVWMLQQRETEAQRDMIVRDVQWAEKTIRLHKQGAENFLQQVVSDLVAGTLDAVSFDQRVTQHIASQGQMVEVVWVGEDAHVRWAAPAATAAARPGEVLAPEDRVPFARARELGLVSYGEPRTSGLPVFQVHVPVREAEEFLGTIVGVFSAERMLAELVPEWFVERYQTSLVNARGQILAISEGSLALDEHTTFEVPLDLPGAGLTLRAVAFQTPGAAPHAFFLIVIAGLAMIVLWSLWLLRDHVRQRRAIEDALREESAFRKAMEESVITGLRAIDLSGRIIYVNPAFCRTVGFDEDELLGAVPPFPYWPEDAYDECRRELEMSSSGRAPASGFDLGIRRRDGERIDVRFYLSPLIDVNGHQTGWMASVADITEPKRVRAALEESQRRFEAVLDGLDAAVFVADAATDVILYANRAFMKIHGYDVVGRSTLRVSVPQPERSEYRVDPHVIDTVALPMELFDGELQHPLSGRWYHLREHASRWVDGRVVRMGIATDITDRRQTEELARRQEERLQHTARLVTMGEMASTLAHELNQPLAAISNYCMGCVTRIEAGKARHEELLAAMTKASMQAERAAKIIGRVRDFVRKSEPRPVSISVAEILDDALAFADIDARRGSGRVVLKIEPDLPPVFADRIMIEQVVVNLVRNAFEAMAGMPPGKRIVEVSAYALDAHAVEVAVADRGPGIDEDERERLFTPFHTTKPEGMGMGLNICRSIVEYHDGHLEFADNPGGGTVFSFVLPTGAVREQVA
ncbi:MAG: PAS domain S-box protein [Azoarcus sp.]|nr:PAS domain S-box protein [Azoarcus sp.]